MSNQYDGLALDHHLSFLLYSGSKETIRSFTPLLEQLDLTYTQYLTMLIIWEHGQLSSKEIGRLLTLDSGTLSPVLRTLEKKALIRRDRDQRDTRNLIITITKEGLDLKDQAKALPKQLKSNIKLSQEESILLSQLLQKLLDGLKENN